MTSLNVAPFRSARAPTLHVATGDVIMLMMCTLPQSFNNASVIKTMYY